MMWSKLFLELTTFKFFYDVGRADPFKIRYKAFKSQVPCDIFYYFIYTLDVPDQLRLLELEF